MPTALLKPPSSAFASGLTSQVLGAPDADLAMAQHRQYRSALESLGLRTIILDSDELPDSCFVEDMAVVGPEHEGGRGFVLATRPVLRMAEQPPVLQALRQALPGYRQVAVATPALLDGGDVLRLGKRWFVGLSARTDRAGFDEFASLARTRGETVTAIPVTGMLHLKTGVSRLDDETVLALPGLSATFGQLGLEVVEVHPEDWHAANLLAFERNVVLPADHPRVRETLQKRGFRTLEVDLSEFKKQDGGASCLSILLP